MGNESGRDKNILAGKREIIWPGTNCVPQLNSNFADQLDEDAADISRQADVHMQPMPAMVLKALVESEERPEAYFENNMADKLVNSICMNWKVGYDKVGM